MQVDHNLKKLRFIEFYPKSPILSIFYAQKFKKKKIQNPTICNTGKRSVREYVLLANSIVLILKMTFILHENVNFRLCRGSKMA